MVRGVLMDSGWRGLTEALAGFATSTSADAIPAAAYDLARVALVDTVGVTLAGGSTETYAVLARTLDAEVGAGGATVLPTAQRTTPRVAALLNATAGHALDYDDATYASYGHPSVVLFPALLAIAETSSVAGRDVAEAYAIGLGCIYALAGGLDVHAHYRRGWHATSTVGVVGAAAAGSRLLGSTLDQTRKALAIAGSLAAGSRRNFGTMTKPLHAGTAASNAVFAATLAAQGFTADEEMLEQPGGYLDLFGQEGADAARAMVSLQSCPWRFLDDPPQLKLYPCCFNTHRGIEAALELVRAGAVEAREIVRVRVHVERDGLTPLRTRLPSTGLEAKFSMEYVVSAALVDGTVSLGSFTDEAVRRSHVMRLAEQVTVSEGNAANRPFATVEVDLRDGSTHVANAELSAHDRLDLTREQVSAKFRDCVAQSGHVWDCESLEEQLWSMVDAAGIQFHPAGPTQRGGSIGRADTR